MLTYPLYRSLPLAERLWGLVADILMMGRRAVIRILLTARGILEGDWSVFGRIWVEDFIVWGQASFESVLKVLGEEMRKIPPIEMKEIGFEMEERD